MERNKVLRGELKQQADTVGGHERAHVRAFRDVLGAKAIKRPHFDFGGATEGSNAFRRTAVAFEDLAVAAYKGQAPHIHSRAYLASALSIDSVEARHAAWIRRLAGKPPVAGPFDEPVSAATATPIMAHALRGPQDEPQGAEVHRFIAAAGAAAAAVAVAGCGAQAGTSGGSSGARRGADIPAPARGGLPIGAPEPLPPRTRTRCNGRHCGARRWPAPRRPRPPAPWPRSPLARPRTRRTSCSSSDAPATPTASCGSGRALPARRAQ